VLAKVLTCAVIGLDGAIVEVEADIGFGLPALTVVGLPDAAVQESRERVRAAVTNSGYVFPMRGVTINLTPADLKKEGPVCPPGSNGTRPTPNSYVSSFFRQHKGQSVAILEVEPRRAAEIAPDVNDQCNTILSTCSPSITSGRSNVTICPCSETTPGDDTAPRPAIGMKS
jgi:hypothetical protein